MTAPAAPRTRLWLAVALALTALKLWLTRGQGVAALGGAGHDDRLYIELAQHLLRGGWLGHYNELTLAQGPFYPLFIAGAFILGLPLFLAQHLFYAAACALFVQALRPALAPAGARLAVYGLLLWNPMTFDSSTMGRVIREHVYGPLGLMIFAGLIALALRRAEPARRQIPWVLLLGLGAGAFYLTREDVAWLAPGGLLLAGAYLHGSWKISRATARRAAGWLGLALVVAALPILYFCARNKQIYDWFGTCEYRSADFRDAYGAMLRVRVGPELPLVPVTREAREAMAAASPLFAEVQRQFDAGVALHWARATEALTHLPPEQGQIAGQWFGRAVRDAVARAGYYGNAAQSRFFYRKLARELNQACDSGRLAAGPERSGFMTPRRAERTGSFLQAAAGLADFVVSFSRFSARIPVSEGSPEELQLFRNLTRERLAAPVGELDPVGAAQYRLNTWKAGVLHDTGKALRPVLLGLFILAQVVGLVRVAQAAWRREWTFLLTVAAAAWVAGTSAVLMHAMIHATSHPVNTIAAFAPVYPVVLAFIGVTLAEAATAWVRPRTSPANQSGGGSV